MAARSTISSCFSFLNEALLFATRSLKIITPLLLYAVVAFPMNTVKLVYVWPLTAEMTRHITEMEEHTEDPWSAEYAGLLGEVRQEAMELLLISVAIALVLLTLAFPKQIVASFFGGRRSLTDLLREAVKYAKGPLVATAVVTMVQVTFVAFLGVYFDTVSEPSPLAYVAYMPILLLGDAAIVYVAASLVDLEGRRGVPGLGQAWRLMTQVGRKEGFVLVLVTLLLPTVLGRLYAVALLYTKQSMGLGLCLLSADKYNLLTNVHDMYYLTVASAYCSQGYHSQAMESKEVAVASDDYAQIPSGEANI